MFQHLLVPLDGSRLAEAALTAASMLAAGVDAEITLLRVIPSPNVSTGTRGTPLAEALVDLRIQDRQEVARYLKAHQAVLRQQGLAVHRRAPEGDSIAETILDVADEQGADTIVMSTHGRSGVSRWVYGSVADKVLRRSHLPVLLIRAQEDSLQRPKQEFRHLLVPLDGSQLAEKALPAAQELASRFDGQITLLRVARAPYIPVGAETYGNLIVDLRDQVHQEAREYLDNQKDTLIQKGYRVRVYVLEGESVANLILDSIGELGAGAIVMSTHGRGGLARWVFGSVAEKVLRHGDVPVCLIRAGENLDTHTR